MRLRQLMNILVPCLQFFVGLLIYTLTLPLLLTWRLSLYLLLPLNAYKPALSHYQKCRVSLHAHSILQPVTHRRLGIICIILLLVQIVLAFALLHKSVVYFVPWATIHFQKTQYKHEHEEAWHCELILHLAVFVLTCVPFFCTLGVGAGLLYYTRKVRIDGQLDDSMMVIGRSGASRVSALPEAENEGAGKFTAVEHETAEDWVAKRPYTSDNAQCETSARGASQCREHSLLVQQSGDERDLEESCIAVPSPAVIPTQRGTVARFVRNPFTPAGVMSIWSSRNGWLGSEYDGRNVRSGNLEEGIEMAEGMARVRE